MSLANKLSIEDVDLKGKRVLIRVRSKPPRLIFFSFSNWPSVRRIADP